MVPLRRRIAHRHHPSRLVYETIDVQLNSTARQSEAWQRRQIQDEVKTGKKQSRLETERQRKDNANQTVTDAPSARALNQTA
jgi:hypothetical protein